MIPFIFFFCIILALLSQSCTSYKPYKPYKPKPLRSLSPSQDLVPRFCNAKSLYRQPISMQCVKDTSGNVGEEDNESRVDVPVPHGSFLGQEQNGSGSMTNTNTRDKTNLYPSTLFDTSTNVDINDDVFDGINNEGIATQVDVKTDAGTKSILQWWIPVVALVIQNSGLILIMRYSRVRIPASGKYLASTAVLCSEILKTTIALLMSFREDAEYNLSKLSFIVKEEVVHKHKDMLLLSVPAFLYMIQNNLQYVATSNLSAPIFQVLYQMKLLASALCSVIILKRKLKIGQWASMLTLAAGVGAVNYSQIGYATSTMAGSPAFNMVGLAAVVCACMTSGIAGAWMEMLLKTAKRSIWLRSVQFGILSMAFATANCVKALPAIQANGGFFTGYTPVVWSVISLQALGGLVIALVVKNADNIVKGFATSLSIILSTYISYIVFGDVRLNLNLFLGAGAVVASTLAFGYFGSSKSN